MGKGDKKSKRGKIIMGSYGIKRPRKKGSDYHPGEEKIITRAKKASVKEEKEEKKAPVKKAPAKKPAAKKSVAQKTATKKTETDQLDTGKSEEVIGKNDEAMVETKKDKSED